MSDIWHNSAMKQENPDTDEVRKDDTASDQKDEAKSKEVGGRDGPDPTRFGDWEKNGRCIDF
jgi:hypothetical protein